jgi:hypothetical protein
VIPWMLDTHSGIHINTRSNKNYVRENPHNHRIAGKCDRVVKILLFNRSLHFSWFCYWTVFYILLKIVFKNTIFEKSFFTNDILFKP